MAVVLALLGCFDFYQTASTYAAANRDVYHLGLQRNRLVPILGDLPPDTVLGYLSDSPSDDAGSAAAFAEVRYILAPRLLVKAGHPVKPRWVLGVFSRVLDPAPIAAANRLEVVRTLGPGLVLFRRLER